MTCILLMCNITCADSRLPLATCNGERWYRFTVPRTGPFTVIITGNGNTNDRYVASVEGANQTDIPIAGTASSYYINGWYHEFADVRIRINGRQRGFARGMARRCEPFEIRGIRWFAHWRVGEAGHEMGWISDKPTRVAWLKTDDTDNKPLAGSTWTLQQKNDDAWTTLATVADCVTDDVCSTDVRYLR